ncbi:MAG: IS4 family transposase, partial [Polyangiales bacterium]
MTRIERSLAKAPTSTALLRANAAYTRSIVANLLGELAPDAGDVLSKDPRAKIRTLEQLLFISGFYVHFGSVRTTAQATRSAGIADISYPKVIDALRQSAPIVARCLAEKLSSWRREEAHALLLRAELRDVVAVDATCVSPPQTQRGESYRGHRLHFQCSLAGGCVREVVYNPDKPRSGEKLTHFNFAAGNLVLADRVYCSVRGIKHVLASQAHALIRYKRGVNLYQDEGGRAGAKLDIVRLARQLAPRAASVGSMRVRLGREGVAVRVVVKRLSQRQYKGELEKLASSKVKLSREAKQMCRYLVLVTTLDGSCGLSDEELVQLYRCRWQIEMYFKRFKSVLKLDQTKCMSDESTSAWLLVKVMWLVWSEQWVLASLSAHGDMARSERARFVQGQQHMLAQLTHILLDTVLGLPLLMAMLDGHAPLLDHPPERRGGACSANPEKPAKTP